jgi:hypothetical protein
MRPPALITDHTDIDIFQIYSIILEIDNISLGTACIATTSAIRALDILGMRKYRILRGKFIEKNLVALTCTFTYTCLDNKATLCIEF